MRAKIELVAERVGDALRLLAPDVGLFTRALEAGAALAPGQRAGTLLRLGRAADLVVPHGASGVVTSPRPERVRAPVGYGDLLYELAPLETGTQTVRRELESADEERAPCLRSPHSGRFYHRPSPGEEALVAPGDVVENGTPVGLIEVMKTFTQVLYLPAHGLPERARVVRVIAGDGEDVGAGAPLIEVAEA